MKIKNVLTCNTDSTNKTNHREVYHMQTKTVFASTLLVFLYIVSMSAS